MDQLFSEREVLHREMYHRVQNTLGVVQALARMTNKERTLPEFLDDFAGRLRALSRANDILRDGAMAGCEVRQLINLAITPFNRGEAFLLDGPETKLPAEAAHHLLLILHELCTNALKHGALSVPEGRIQISWKDDHGSFRLNWREAGGPPVTPPSRKGLGTKLQTAQRTFDVITRYDRDGVCCSLAQVAQVALSKSRNGHVRGQMIWPGR